MNCELRTKAQLGNLSARNNERRIGGQTIVELVVTIGMVVILVTGLLAGAVASLKAGQYGKTKSLAVRWAQEGLEITRNLRNRDWDTFATYGDIGGKKWCLDKMGIWTPTPDTCPPNIDGIFSRLVTLQWLEPRMEVNVVVSWTDARGANQTAVTTYFTRWQ